MANVNKNAVVLEALKFAREKCETAQECADFIKSVAMLYDTNGTNNNGDAFTSEINSRMQQNDQAKQK